MWIFRRIRELLEAFTSALTVAPTSLMFGIAELLHLRSVLREYEHFTSRNRGLFRQARKQNTDVLKMATMILVKFQ
jgi:hypothetical protein